MSSPSRKVGLRKRLAIAAKSAAAGATAAIMTPVIFYRSGVKRAESKKVYEPIDWGRFAKTINDSGVLNMLAADLVQMTSSRHGDSHLHDEYEDPEGDHQVH